VRQPRVHSAGDERNHSYLDSNRFFFVVVQD
jgi:hypothetical protein